MLDAQAAEQRMACTRCCTKFITVSIEYDSLIQQEFALNPSSLGQIKHFIQTIKNVQRDSECNRLVLCAGDNDRVITICAFLIGGYMILCGQASVEAVSDAFQAIKSRLVGMEESANLECSLVDSWEALHCGKMQGWLDFERAEPDIDRCIDMEEYIHYDNPANGKLHVIIPSRLIAFPCPSDLEVDEESGEAPQWLDMAGGRHFGPDYYADILGDFDVQLVVRCDASATYDDAAFASRGLAVERLGGALEMRPQRLLQEVDRFLTLARLVPGMIGIHGADAGLGSGGELLVSSLLIKRHGFRARSALAWLRITHPAVDAQRTLRFAVLPHQPPPAVPKLAPGALHHHSAADLRCLPREDTLRFAAALRRCASAPAALDDEIWDRGWDAITQGEAGPPWADVPEPAVFEALDGASLH
eukprot:CAMPEP_0172172926 /NCGR_PEP_ID=MMETSP1050-20130122/12735_1 /TAXON_ID=233186 /ORGANISM="Cryptomonas curvata, Strain CCAP979/52" /LENGTH=416 /DNA_ID=CAMNT_0012844555 /DNA_START=150 /DNA_END=1400 /DNA_ORIENTATION=-